MLVHSPSITLLFVLAAIVCVNRAVGAENFTAHPTLSCTNPHSARKYRVSAGAHVEGRLQSTFHCICFLLALIGAQVLPRCGQWISSIDLYGNCLGDGGEQFLNLRRTE